MQASGIARDALERRAGVRERLRADFDLAITMLFGTIAIVVLSGFAVFRFLTGHVLGGIVNSAIVLLLLAVLSYGWRSGNTLRTGTTWVVLTVIGCIASALVLGKTAVYWAYLILSINFALTRRTWALAANLALIASMVLLPGMFTTGFERAAFAATALLVTTYGWIFAVRLAHQHRRLEVLAAHDPLTGAGNRRLLQHDLERLTEARAGDGAVLAVLDLDHFKQVNDTLGHEAGDRVLVRLVEIARGRLRKTDGIYRFGGEEFVLLLPATDTRAARPLLEDLHALLNAGLAGPSGGVTVSIGAAALAEGERWSAWLARADAALYRAKQAGRNRVEIAGEEDGNGFDRRAPAQV
jgi:diguanylate cyclase (GGDEF)-like protein